MAVVHVRRGDFALQIPLKTVCYRRPPRSAEQTLARQFPVKYRLLSVLFGGWAVPPHLFKKTEKNSELHGFLSVDRLRRGHATAQFPVKHRFLSALPGQLRALLRCATDNSPLLWYLFVYRAVQVSRDSERSASWSCRTGREVRAPLRVLRVAVNQLAPEHASH